MTVVSYSIGSPLSAPLRGGDCRARDLSLGRNVHGPHRFALPDHCKFGNGIVRATVSAAGTAPAVTVEAYVGVVIRGTYTTTYTATYGGIAEDQGWQTSATITIDSPSVAAVLTEVRTVLISAEIVILRLVAPLMGDAFVTLRRGEPMVRILHGERREGIDIDRRVRLTASPSPVGVSPVAGRVQESGVASGDYARFVAALDPTTADAGAFSLTASSVTSARFGAGVGTNDDFTSPAYLHRQLLSITRQRIEIDEVVA